MCCLTYEHARTGRNHRNYIEKQPFMNLEITRIALKLISESFAAKELTFVHWLLILESNEFQFI
jgi:hypothetical protein